MLTLFLAVLIGFVVYTTMNAPVLAWVDRLQAHIFAPKNLRAGNCSVFIFRNATNDRHLYADICESPVQTTPIWTFCYKATNDRDVQNWTHGNVGLQWKAKGAEFCLDQQTIGSVTNSRSSVEATVGQPCATPGSRQDTNANWLPFMATKVGTHTGHGVLKTA